MSIEDTVSGLVLELRRGTLILLVLSQLREPMYGYSLVKKLNDHLPRIREQFKVASIGIFGSVARGEDSADSDIDILFSFREGCISLDAFLGLADYLESLFEKKVDLIPDDGLSPYMRPYIEAEVIWSHG